MRETEAWQDCCNVNFTYAERHICTLTGGVLAARLIGERLCHGKNLLHARAGTRRDWHAKLRPFSAGAPAQRALPKHRAWGWWVRREHSPGSVASPSRGAERLCRSCKGKFATRSRTSQASKGDTRPRSEFVQSSPDRNNSKTSSPQQTWEMLLDALLESALLLYRHYLLGSITRTEQGRSFGN